jgi:spermidine/putrescine transport system permease protein
LTAAQARKWSFGGTAFAAALVLFFLYLPLLVVVLFAFNKDASSLGRWSGFSTRWFIELGEDRNLLRAIDNSLTVAVPTSCVAVIVSFMAALASTDRRRRGASLLDLLVAIPLAVPEVVLAVALLLVFSLSGVRLGLATVALGHLMLILPFAYLPIRAGLRDLDPDLAAASGDLFASPAKTLFVIVLPLVWPAILVGAMLSFIGSFSDSVLSYFLSGPGATTLPVYVYGMLRVGVTPVINAVATIVLCLSFCVLVVVHLLRSRSKTEM